MRTFIVTVKETLTTEESRGFLKLKTTQVKNEKNIDIEIKAHDKEEAKVFVENDLQAMKKLRVLMFFGFGCKSGFTSVKHEIIDVVEK